VTEAKLRGIAGPLGMSPTEVRVLGCLLEKQKTTPDVYPLSLNALRLACNQSTNREPVVDYGEAEIREALHRLERRGLVRLASGAGSRAAKYRHLLADALPMDDGERAILCVLMLRGPQTPGELKQRTERMFRFAELDGVHATLQRLVERQLAVRLERRPGQKEERYSQLLRDDSESRTVAGPQWEHAQPESACELQSPEGRRELPAKDAGSANPLTLEGLHLRVERLEREVAELRAGTRGPH
jgi:uncharacterized protein YceH (UPF0502 family)